MKRPSWDNYFMGIAHKVAERATCYRRQVGAVLVRDKRILSTGERHELCRGQHAEKNAIIQCAVHGVSTSGATIYCTLTPCVMCAKDIISAGIKEVVCKGSYNDDLWLGLLNEAGVSVSVFKYCPGVGTVPPGPTINDDKETS